MTVRPVSYFVFSTSFYVVGLLMAVFLGLGWLFLLLGIRRAFTALPFTRRWLRMHLAGIPETQPQRDPQMDRLTGGLRVAAALAWIALAGIIFVQGNPSLMGLLAQVR